MSALTFSCVLAFGLAAMSVPLIAGASTLLTTNADAISEGAMAVRELMRLDTELAIRASRSRLSNVDQHLETALALSDQPGSQLRLIAIYGVGKRLLAEIMVGNQPYVYMRGQPLPIGAKTGSHVYKLSDISSSCVQLERQDEAHTLCLYPSLKVSR